jgi:NhaP-type Na+/H+ or K+/H+ antiporter
MIWAVGLRGAVAYGLALNLPQIEGESDEGIPAIESATLVTVVLSTLILGGATGPLLRFFDLQVAPLARSPSLARHESRPPNTYVQEKVESLQRCCKCRFYMHPA